MAIVSTLGLLGLPPWVAYHPGFASTVVAVSLLTLFCSAEATTTASRLCARVYRAPSRRASPRPRPASLRSATPRRLTACPRARAFAQASCCPLVAAMLPLATLCFFRALLRLVSGAVGSRHADSCSPYAAPGDKPLWFIRRGARRHPSGRSGRTQRRTAVPDVFRYLTCTGLQSRGGEGGAAAAETEAE